MKLERVGRVELVYAEIDEEFPFADGGQVYGLLKGHLELEGVRGTVHATNLARQRPDGAFTPTLRGILSDGAGAKAYFQMDGISIRDGQAKPPRRIVTTGVTLWSVDATYRKWNEVYLLAEMTGGAVGDSWGVLGPVYRCVPEV